MYNASFVSLGLLKMRKSLQPLGALLVSACVSGAPLAASAAVYDALCGGVDCKIVLDGKGMSGPAGFIPAHRIAQWYTGGGEEHNKAASVAGATGGAAAGMVAGAAATCWTIILCPVGLIGGAVAGGMGGSRAGKSADFFFTVIGYTQNGKKVTQSFNFLNKKPAARVMQELPAVAGLGMGEMRSIEEIKAGDLRAVSAGTGRAQLPGSIGQMPIRSGSSVVLPDSLGTPKTQVSVASGKKCWSEFIKKPGMKAWADANPVIAEKKKESYGDC